MIEEVIRGIYDVLPDIIKTSTTATVAPNPIGILVDLTGEDDESETAQPSVAAQVFRENAEAMLL